jgi:hypothetical protein
MTLSRFFVKVLTDQTAQKSASKSPRARHHQKILDLEKKKFTLDSAKGHVV